jgi:hypothetical protein
MGTGSLQTVNPAGFLFCCTGAILDFGQKNTSHQILTVGIFI